MLRMRHMYMCFFLVFLLYSCYAFYFFFFNISVCRFRPDARVGTKKKKKESHQPCAGRDGFAQGSKRLFEWKTFPLSRVVMVCMCVCVFFCVKQFLPLPLTLTHPGTTYIRTHARHTTFDSGTFRQWLIFRDFAFASRSDSIFCDENPRWRWRGREKGPARVFLSIFLHVAHTHTGGKTRKKTTDSRTGGEEASALRLGFISFYFSCAKQQEWNSTVGDGRGKWSGPKREKYILPSLTTPYDTSCIFTYRQASEKKGHPNTLRKTVTVCVCVGENEREKRQKEKIMVPIFRWNEREKNTHTHTEKSYHFRLAYHFGGSVSFLVAAFVVFSKITPLAVCQCVPLTHIHTHTCGQKVGGWFMMAPCMQRLN